MPQSGRIEICGNAHEQKSIGEDENQPSSRSIDIRRSYLSSDAVVAPAVGIQQPAEPPTPVLLGSNAVGELFFRDHRVAPLQDRTERWNWQRIISRLHELLRQRLENVRHSGAD